MSFVAVLLILGVLCPAAFAQNPAQSANPPASPSTTASSPAVTAQPPEAVAQKYVELWNTGNLELINSIFEFPAIMTSRGSRVRLDAGMLKKVIQTWRHSIPDLAFKVEDTIVQGDKVVLRLVFTGTYKERLFPSTADPRNHERGIRATAMWILDIRNGKIRQIWEEYDEIRMHYEMGGFWRSNEELDAAAKASEPKSQPVPSTRPSPRP